MVTGWIPVSTSIWSGLYISCSLGATVNICLFQGALVGSSCSEAPTGQHRCFCPLFSFHFYFVASSKPSQTDMLVRLPPVMLRLFKIYEILVSHLTGWACLTHIWDAKRKQLKSLALQFLLKLLSMLIPADKVKCPTWWLCHDCSYEYVWLGTSVSSPVFVFLGRNNSTITYDEKSVFHLCCVLFWKLSADTDI